MASARLSSPAGDISPPTSPQLTPRSKIKAMLAAVDDEGSDTEPTGPIDTKTLFKTIDRSRDSHQDAPSVQDTLGGDDDTEEDNDEEEIIRPRGRLAARMHANFEKDTAKELSTTSRANKTIKPHPAAQGSEPESEAGDEDDQDLPAAPRRRLAKRARSKTPGDSVDMDTPDSPGLFVSPGPSRSPAQRATADGSDSDAELPTDISKNNRFKELVAKKRAQRLAKEAEEERKREERAQRIAEQMPAADDLDDDDVSDISDDAGGRRLTQQVSRPPRKASKKALEEMNRETQRISRSLQLAHEATTKKKITKASLFERFNFRTEKTPVDTSSKPASSSRPTTPSSAAHTDVEMGNTGTPPSSPPAAIKPTEDPPEILNALEASGAQGDVTISENENAELLSLEDTLTQLKQQGKDKGKNSGNPTDSAGAKKPEITKSKRQVRVKLPPVQASLATVDSDDELEITGAHNGRLDAIFNRIPEKKAQESTSMHIIRQLAHLASPGKENSRGRNAKVSMTTGELQMTLQQRARAQAKLERDRRLELLRSKGVHVQTAEEREREREQVEDMVARARQEIEEIMAREREDAKQARKDRKKNGEDDALDWDDSDDDSYDGSEEGEPNEPEELVLSGSEDEEGGGDADEGELAANPLFDSAAEEDSEEEEEATPKAVMDTLEENNEEEDLESTITRPRRSKKHTQVISDDEDEEELVHSTPKPKAIQPRSPSAPGSGTPKVPTSVLRSATKTFIPGLPIANAAPAGLGLTQIFAGTMDDSQAGPTNGSPQEFMPSFDIFPDSQFSATADQSQDYMAHGSQPTQKADTQRESQGVQLHFSQSQIHGFDSFMDIDGTQTSEFVEPTQDGGFQELSPLKQRFVEPPMSTVNTVLLGNKEDNEDINVQESPLVRKRGKLLRRRPQRETSVESIPPTEIPRSPVVSPTTAMNNVPMANEDSASSTAFRLMEKAARREKRRQKKFDKKKSKATGMVEEQAEESEDEYAGLGGADGEDSSEDDEELRKEMIDDSKANEGDEANLAGLFADRERAADAAQVDKLFRDITTGMLRKRRRGGNGNNDFDLSDSDDGGEARRRMKRRQFAKMQKALFADERIGKIAENPRNAAFLKSIEDRGSDEEWEFGDNFTEPGTGSGCEDSQDKEKSQEDKSKEAEDEERIPDSQPNIGRKRTRTDEHAARPPPNARRTKDGVRPASITDVRRELSSLLEEPNASVDSSIVPATEVGSDSEDERESERPSSSNKENYRPSVVDRISLKRNSSAVSNGSTGPASRLAFVAPASSSSGFKVPALLRRATTNSLMSSSSSSTLSASNSGPQASAGRNGAASLNKANSFSEEGKLKKNAGKRSGINYFARENERRAKVQEKEKRREEKKWKGAEGRGRAVGGLFGGGSFE
ncbi:MRC1-like domain-containing protein [Xylariaceae sp. FL0016]|nr:MRC1-like domain-containing protein [Xylariaceae sp. FL0016]